MEVKSSSFSVMSLLIFFLPFPLCLLCAPKSSIKPGGMFVIICTCETKATEDKNILLSLLNLKKGNLSCSKIFHSGEKNAAH